MATKAQAFQTWAQGFGVPAYSSASVPNDATLPYITYDFASAMFGEQQQAIVLNLWYPATSTEADANAKAEEIGQALGIGGVRLTCEGGMVWLLRGEPFYQAVTDANGLHRRYINITAEFFTIS